MATKTTIAIGIWNGVEELDFVGPYEVLTAWGRMADDREVEVSLVADGEGVVECAHGLRVLPDRTWREVGSADVVLLPGGNARSLHDRVDFHEQLRAVAGNGTLMTSVCTGATVYAVAGLLDGKPATTHWGALDSLAELGSGIEVRPEAPFVDAGDVITAAGVSAGIDMALYLVKRLYSEERARDVRRYIQYDPEPPV